MITERGFQFIEVDASAVNGLDFADPDNVSVVEQQIGVANEPVFGNLQVHFDMVDGWSLAAWTNNLWARLESLDDKSFAIVAVAGALPLPPQEPAPPLVGGEFLDDKIVNGMS